jgi:uncharacterized protein YcfJ
MAGMKFARPYHLGVMNGSGHMKYRVHVIAGVVLLAAVLGCSDSLTTREETAGVGSVVGANVGAGIGSTFGYAYTGGMAGAVLGLCVGAVVGGHAEAIAKRQMDLDQKIQQCDADIQRQSEKLEELKKELQGQ